MFEQALRADRKREGRDNRAHPREPFPSVQLIAPKRGVRMPPRSKFESVRCFDLSAAGFSFVTSTPLACDELFVALGTEPHLKFLIHWTGQAVGELRIADFGLRIERPGNRD
ncbi:MAG: hypothetical protein HY000_16925 [Planctomycetes bacterium]|nr:hypothetical protein [Planctomycetota bacterium]